MKQLLALSYRMKQLLALSYRMKQLLQLMKLALSKGKIHHSDGASVSEDFSETV